MKCTGPLAASPLLHSLSGYQIEKHFLFLFYFIKSMISYFRPSSHIFIRTKDDTEQRGFIHLFYHGIPKVLGNKMFHFFSSPFSRIFFHYISSTFISYLLYDASSTSDILKNTNNQMMK
jgi:hypothetical protein